MARGPAKQANQVFNESQGIAGTAGNNANSLFSTLFPIYSQEALNPQGFAPGDEAAMNTAGQQATGGGVSSIVGQNNLTGARTRNVGGFQTAGDEAMRTKMRTDSQNAVNIKGKNAMAKLEESSEGLKGLQSLYGTNESELLGSLGLSDQAINTEVKAGQSGWLQNFLNILQTLNASGNAAANLKSAGAF